MFKLSPRDDDGSIMTGPADRINEGPFVIGYAICFGLMGVLVVQGFIYFSKFPDDRLWMRLLVSTVLILEVLFTVFALHGFWIGVTANSTDLSSIAALGVGGNELKPDPLWSFVALAPLTVSTLTHAFFCWRIWAVKRSLLVPAVVMLVSLMQCAMVTYGGIVYGLVPNLTDDHPLPFYIPAWLSGSLFCDLTITVYMTLILLRAKSKFHNTRNVLVRLAKLTIETGFITTTAAAVELVLAIAFPVTLFYMTLFYIVSKLYANCLLATLNARLVIRGDMDKHKSVTEWEYTASEVQLPSRETKTKRSQPHGGDAIIQIQTQVETDVELRPRPMDDIRYLKQVMEVVDEERGCVNSVSLPALPCGM